MGALPALQRKLQPPDLLPLPAGPGALVLAQVVLVLLVLVLALVQLQTPLQPLGSPRP